MNANPLEYTTNKDLEVRSQFFTKLNSSKTAHSSKVISLKPTEVTVDSMHERFIKNIMHIIEAHIANPKLCVGLLAKETCLSNVQLYRKLKALTGRTPNELVRDFRLARAHSLIIQQYDRVSEIAYKVGFSNLSYFTKCFKTKYKKCPSEFYSHQKEYTNIPL